MLWKPLDDALIADGITDVYRGSKAADGHVGVSDGYKDERGITYHSPIWGWTDDDVFAYLKEVGAAMPEHYGTVNNSFDCIFCTAFLNHNGAGERLRWTRKKYPEVWPELEGRLKLVREILDDERAAVDDALSVVNGDGFGNV
jgi:phosphoadenosine phosphosulfate reductase